MESRAHALAAGLFTVLFLIAAFATLWWLSGKRDVTRDYVVVTTGNLTGLNPQSQVRYRGIRAGKVLDIDLDPADRRNILITIRVDGDIPLTKSTIAQLNYQGVTGLAYVQLSDSGESNEVLQSEDGRLPRIELKPSALAELGDAALDMAAQGRQVLGRLSVLFNDGNTERIGRTLENLERATAALDGSIREVPRTLAAMRELIASLDIARANAAIANLERASREAAPLTAELRALVASLQSLSARLDTLAAQAGTEVMGTTLPRINALTQEINASSRHLRRLLDQLETAPETLIFGRARGRPGPGEPGFEGRRP